MYLTMAGLGAYGCVHRSTRYWGLDAETKAEALSIGAKVAGSGVDAFRRDAVLIFFFAISILSPHDTVHLCPISLVSMFPLVRKKLVNRFVICVFVLWHGHCHYYWQRGKYLEKRTRELRQ